MQVRAALQLQTMGSQIMPDAGASHSLSVVQLPGSLLHAPQPGESSGPTHDRPAAPHSAWSAQQIGIGHPSAGHSWGASVTRRQPTYDGVHEHAKQRSSVHAGVVRQACASSWSHAGNTSSSALSSSPPPGRPATHAASASARTTATAAVTGRTSACYRGSLPA